MGNPLHNHEVHPANVDVHFHERVRGTDHVLEISPSAVQAFDALASLGNGENILLMPKLTPPGLSALMALSSPGRPRTDLPDALS